MDPEIEAHMNDYLTPADRLVLENLLRDVKTSNLKNNLQIGKSSKGPSHAAPGLISRSSGRDSGYESHELSNSEGSEVSSDADIDAATHPTVLRQRKDKNNALSPSPSAINDSITIDQLNGLNDSNDPRFEPSVCFTYDLPYIRSRIPKFIDEYFLKPYISVAGNIARNKLDVVMITHLLYYFTIALPSATFLFYRFSWIHGIIHVAMQVWWAGTYTLLMHQHIHGRGVLKPGYKAFDVLFPFLLDPLYGHTWNTYYYHHVKHHHVEGNGPDDLSSTIRFQRDEPLEFLRYLFRFYFMIWLDLPLYFLRKNKPGTALKTALSEWGAYAFLTAMTRYHWRASIFTLLLPLFVMRTAMMVGNFGQHAFVDDEEPDSDFRSSITLIDVASNRFCYNDGYHTSHHLNPLRHWRDHPNAFLRQKSRYAEEHALVFKDIDYLMLTINLLRKNYMHLAKCLVPTGAQIGMSLEEIAAMLRKKTRKFSEEEIARKFKR